MKRDTNMTSAFSTRIVAVVGVVVRVVLVLDAVAP